MIFIHANVCRWSLFSIGSTTSAESYLGGSFDELSVCLFVSNMYSSIGGREQLVCPRTRQAKRNGMGGMGILLTTRNACRVLTTRPRPLIYRDCMSREGERGRRDRLSILLYSTPTQLALSPLVGCIRKDPPIQHFLWPSFVGGLSYRGKISINLQFGIASGIKIKIWPSEVTLASKCERGKNRERKMNLNAGLLWINK